MAGNNNMDLVPKEALEQLRNLNKELDNSTGRMKTLLAEVSRVNSEFNKSGLAYKQLTASISDYNKANSQLTEELKQQQNIIARQEKLKQNVINAVSNEVKSVQELRKEYDNVNKSVQTNVSLQDISKKAYDEARQSIAKQREEYIRLENELKSIREQMNQLDAAYGKGGRTQESYIQRKAVLIQMEEDQKGALKTLGDTINYNQQIISTSIGTYANLSAQYSRLKIILNQMTDAETRNGLTKQQLEAHAKSLYLQMSVLQKQTGKNTLDVGKYDLAVNDLTRTLSIIDPRIGMLATKIQNISTLKKAWIDTTTKLSSALNITSRSANLLLGGTIALIAGGIYLAVKAYREWKEEQDKVSKANREFNDTMVKGAQNAQGEITKLKLLYDATQDINKPQAERLRAATELQKLYPDYLGNMSKEEILAGKGASAYEKLSSAIIAAAKARAAQDKITENQSKILDLEAKKAENEAKKLDAENRLKVAEARDSYKQAINDPYAEGAMLMLADAANASRIKSEIREYNQEIENSTKEIEKYGEANKRLADSIKIEDLLFGGGGGASNNNRTDAEKQAADELAVYLIKRDAEVQKEILQNNRNSYNERVAALNSYLDETVRSIELSRDNQLKNGELTASQRTLIEEKAKNDIAKVRMEGDKLLLDITKDYVQQQTDIVNKSTADQAALLTERQQTELAELSSMYAQGIIQREEYERQKSDLSRKYQDGIFQNETDGILSLLDIAGLTDEQRLQLEKKLGEARVKYNQEVNSRIISDEERAAQKREEIEKYLAERRKELIQDSIGAVSDLFSAFTESRIQSLEEEAEINQEWRDNELNEVERLENAGAISKEEAETRKWAIDEKSKAKEDEINRRKREAQIKQAIFEKSLASGEIIINTASAVMKNTAQLGFLAAIPINALTIALGAVQLAAVTARPLPKYRHGGEHRKDGPAIVGDGGRHELVMLPDGTMYKTPKVDTLVNLPKGTTILPDYERAVSRIGTDEAPGRDKPMVIVENRKQLRILEAQSKIMRRTEKNISHMAKITKTNNIQSRWQ